MGFDIEYIKLNIQELRTFLFEIVVLTVHPHGLRPNRPLLPLVDVQTPE